MSYNFFIVGGDMRMVCLAKKLASDGNTVKVMGFEKIGYDKLLNNNIKIAHSINEVEENDIIISSIPLTIDNKYVYAPYSDKKIELNDLKGKKVIAGKLPKGIEGKDILDDEVTTVFNTIPTAEGAISKAIEETNITLNNANVLVLGFGRVGKVLCDRLKKIGAKVYCEARKREDLCWIETYGYEPIPLGELDKSLCKMKVIFNTIPSLILNKSRLILLKEDTVIIDLASGKGGVDFESARKLKINAIQYLAIPGKIAPETTAEYVKRYIYRTINVMWQIIMKFDKNITNITFS